MGAAAGQVAQVHAGIFDIRHTAGQNFLRVFEDILTISRGGIVDLFRLCLCGVHQLHGHLLCALGDLFVRYQYPCAFLCLLDDVIRIGLGVL